MFKAQLNQDSEALCLVMEKKKKWQRDAIYPNTASFFFPNTYDAQLN